MGDIHRVGCGGKWRTLKSDLRQRLSGLRGESFPASASRRGTMPQPGRHRRYCWPSIDSLRSLPRTILEHARLTSMLRLSPLAFGRAALGARCGRGLTVRNSSRHSRAAPPIVRKLSPLDPSRSAAIRSQHSVHHRWRARHAGSRRLRARSECR